MIHLGPPALVELLPVAATHSVVATQLVMRTVVARDLDEVAFISYTPYPMRRAA